MIFVHYQARLGNNLFQWAFARVLSKMSGVPMSAPPISLFPGTYSEQHAPGREFDFVLPENCCFVNLAEWVDNCKRGHVLVRGYPHNISFFEMHRDWLIRELVPRFGDYAKAEANDIVMHVRWGDYFYPMHKDSFAYEVEAYVHLLPSLSYERCLIVTDSPCNQLVQNLVRDHRGVLISKSVDHDYRTLYHARRLILSPSTFSWWAAWSGDAAEIYQPHEMGFWKKARQFALDLPGPRVRRFDSTGRIV